MNKYFNTFGEIDLDFCMDVSIVESELNILYKNRLVKYLNKSIIEYVLIDSIYIRRGNYFLFPKYKIRDLINDTVYILQNEGLIICTELTNNELNFLCGIIKNKIYVKILYKTKRRWFCLYIFIWNWIRYTV